MVLAPRSGHTITLLQPLESQGPGAVAWFVRLLYPGRVPVQSPFSFALVYENLRQVWGVGYVPYQHIP